MAGGLRRVHGVRGGFGTRLCKPRHPFTKGKVERLIRFVKGNFLAGEVLHYRPQRPGARMVLGQSGALPQGPSTACRPTSMRQGASPPRRRWPRPGARALPLPSRRISFDGFVSFGAGDSACRTVAGQTCRVSRDGDWLHYLLRDLSRGWPPIRSPGPQDSFCEDQYADAQPVELPTTPVATVIAQLEPPKGQAGLPEFDFEGRLR